MIRLLLAAIIYGLIGSLALGVVADVSTLSMAQIGLFWAIMILADICSRLVEGKK